jgi:hypothetical protein
MSEEEEVTATIGDEVKDPEARKKVNKWIEQYVFVRDCILKMKERHETELHDLVDIQNKLTGRLQEFMDTVGVDSVKSEHGTAYSSTKFSTALADPGAFMQYVISTQKFELLDRKANVTAVKAHVQEHGDLPPGVNLSSIKTLGVRRPTKKS